MNDVTTTHRQKTAPLGSSGHRGPTIGIPRKVVIYDAVDRVLRILEFTAILRKLTRKETRRSNTTMESILCRYFLHGACNHGERCNFSHDLQSKPNMVCRYYLKGNCSYGKQCRYDHSKPSVPVNLTSESNATDCPRKMVTLTKLSPKLQATTDLNSKEENWVDAPEFIPGSRYHGAEHQKTTENMPYVNVARFGLKEVSFVDDSMKFDLMCPYRSLHDCPNGKNCEYLHALQCDVCDEYCLHPMDVEQQLGHRRQCLEEMENEMEYSFAVQRSTSMKCSICFENVLEKTNPKERFFGIMENCNHVFCLPCIRKWRGSPHHDRVAIRACPVCRQPSGFVTPSDVFVEDGPEKQKLIVRYKEVLSNKPCRHFNEGKGRCPFGSSCFYKHAYPDGKCEEKVPDLRFYANSDGDNAAVRDHNLWDFIEGRDMDAHVF